MSISESAAFLILHLDLIVESLRFLIWTDKNSGFKLREYIKNRSTSATMINTVLKKELESNEVGL